MDPSCGNLYFRCGCLRRVVWVVYPFNGPRLCNMCCWHSDIRGDIFGMSPTTTHHTGGSFVSSTPSPQAFWEGVIPSKTTEPEVSQGAHPLGQTHIIFSQTSRLANSSSGSASSRPSLVSNSMPESPPLHLPSHGPTRSWLHGKCAPNPHHSLARLPLSHL